jgi:hypothetical protein
VSIQVTADTSSLEKLFEDLETFTANIHGKKGYPQNPVRNAARAMSKVTLEEAKSIAPVDTGNLAEALKLKPLSVRFRDNSARLGNSKEYFFVGAEVKKSRAFYITPLELGWSRDGASYEGAHFISAAAKNSASEAQTTFTTKLRKDLDKIRNKILAASKARNPK